MRIHNLYVDAAGESHFRDIEVAWERVVSGSKLSALMPATGIIFRQSPADYGLDWHNAPRRQYIIMLNGHIEIEVSDSEKREFKAGDVILLEDTTGKGHRTRELSGKPRRSIFIALD